MTSTCVGELRSRLLTLGGGWKPEVITVLEVVKWIVEEVVETKEELFKYFEGGGLNVK